jgi:hypothetical protein
MGAPMIKLLVFIARCLGLLQAALGRGQTHVLTAAQDLGWDPGTELGVLTLQKRQANLMTRKSLKRIRKQARLERKEQRKLQRAAGLKTQPKL